MQKYLWLPTILYLITGCNQQKEKIPTETIKDNIPVQLNSKEKQALDFLIQTLTDNSIAPGSKTYTQTKINELVTYLTPIKIKEMLKNMTKIFENNKNIEDDLNKIYDHDPQKPILHKRFTKIINDYKKNLKIAASNNSLDKIKTNIQNIPTDEIIEIKAELKRAISVQKILDNLDYHYIGHLFYLIKSTTDNSKEENPKNIYDLFNKLVINTNPKDIEDMFEYSKINHKSY